MPDDDAAPALLEYASAPVVREPWGPLLFQPSRRSLVLLALLAASACWLALRHDPWRRVGTLPGDGVAPPTFTRDGLLLTIDALTGANLYDPATARPIRNVFPRADPQTYRYFVLDGGERILALPYVERIATVYDVRSGRVVERLPNPDGLGSQLLLVAPDAPRMVTVRRPPSTPTATRPSPDLPPALAYWDLTRTPPTSRPVALWPLGSDPLFSPDGSRILQLDVRRDRLKLLDGHTLAPVRTETLPSGGPLNAWGFAGADYFWLLRTETQVSLYDTLELRSVRTGQVVSSLMISLGTPGSETWSTTASDDGRTFALLAITVSRSGSAATPPADAQLHVYDAATGEDLLTRGASAGWGVRFLPNSRRLLAGDAETGRLAVFDPPHRQPLALLSGAASSFGQGTAQVSPDGRTIITALSPANPGVASAPALEVFRPAGRDCPESRLGALVFPHTWLTAALLAALTFSLLADARRARTAAARRVSPWLIAGIVSVALPLTAHALVVACLGRAIRTPAPLLLITAIGLATHARAWRVTALLLLCAMLPLLAYEAHHLRTLGLLAQTPYPLLDRSYEIPHRIPFAAAVTLAVMTVSGIYLLIRPRAELDPA